jgi:predicted acetyltransferase
MATELEVPGSHLRFQVRPARPDERQVCENLLQLYMYDFSEFAGGTVRADGRFPYHDDFGDRWGQPWFHPYLLVVLDEDPRDKITEWRPAGFAFVANYSCFSERPEANQWYMDDFFVMRKYRRGGAGTALARFCFDAYRGRWEVGEMPRNTAAQAFWRKLIAEYTGGHFREVDDAPAWNGPLQIFRNDR